MESKDQRGDFLPSGERELVSMDNHCERFPVGDTGHNSHVKTDAFTREMSLLQEQKGLWQTHGLN